MAGKRQHFIPRFLQASFASHTNSKEIFTWVYPKGREPYNTNIINVGVEGFFFEENGDSSVDDSITAAEGKFAPLVEFLRSNDGQILSDVDSISELLAHLEVRTRHIRQSFLASGKWLIDEFVRFMGNTEKFVPHMLKRCLKEPQIFLKSMNDEFDKLGIPHEARPAIIAKFAPHFGAIMVSKIEEFSLMAPVFKEILPLLLEKSAKSGHIKALRTGIAPPVKVETYSALKYEVAKVDNNKLPLGDSLVIFQGDGDYGFKAFLDLGVPLIAVFLPLSPNSILVGRRTGQPIDLQSIPNAIAKCSRDFFITIEKSSYYSNLGINIGEWASILSEKQMEAILVECLNDE